ncbi:ComEA family DNA-binding protein [Glycomyces terrestris]|uniref:Helix-hairpin-helix domain-containing protein n=1 Tax=Glycomyces terrestris TaxID=2493553 RepID=A0A426UXA3_9ACTN|nr:helix-hairpin-helix domain-containing protein [Glycomyces terrestris]RRR99259.1 helix-hairpin-helix domain-containing protein [Glycomyces terrestris]
MADAALRLAWESSSMTAPGPYAPPVDEKKRLSAHRAGRAATYLWALSPVLTCGYATPVMLAIALARRRDNLVLAALIVHSALLASSCLVMGTYADKVPLWGDVLIYSSWGIAAIGGAAHLLVIRPAVFPAGPRPQVPVAHLSNAEVLDRARKLREQARRTAEADPMLAKRLAIGRPDLPRQFDDGGLVDVNHAPLHVLTSLPGVTERSARQILEWVERSGPFASLGEVMLVIEISPTFEHHLREYCVFIP